MKAKRQGWTKPINGTLVYSTLPQSRLAEEARVYDEKKRHEPPRPEKEAKA